MIRHNHIHFDDNGDVFYSSSSIHPFPIIMIRNLKTWQIRQAVDSDDQTQIHTAQRDNIARNARELALSWVGSILFSYQYSYHFVGPPMRHYSSSQSILLPLLVTVVHHCNTNRPMIIMIQKINLSSNHHYLSDNKI